MNKENQEFKCNFCDVVFKHRQSKHKHSLLCKKGGGEVKNFVCIGCLKEFTKKDVLLKRQRGWFRREEKEKENAVQVVRKNSAKQQTLSGINKSMKCNWCKKSFKCKYHFEKHTCCSVATKRNSVQKKKSKSPNFSEETTFDLEKACNTYMLNDFQKSSLSLPELSMTLLNPPILFRICSSVNKGKFIFHLENQFVTWKSVRFWKH